MSDRFPLIVNEITKRIEELAGGDNLELTGNGIVINGDTGDGKYLTSNGSSVLWGNPGNVYLTQTQTLTNKTLENCTISGSLNNFTDIPNSALINSGIGINGTIVPLGGTINVPDKTYSISVEDSSNNSEKIIRLSSIDTFGAQFEDDIVLSVENATSIPSGSNSISLSLNRVNDKIVISGTAIDTNDVTRIAANSETLSYGDFRLLASGNASISTANNSGVKEITITSTYTETDPIFSASDAAGIIATDISNWDTAYGWGNHASVGYLTTYTETDPVFSASEAASITPTDTSNWDTAYGWGNHASVGYLTTYTETDPIFTASVAAGITLQNITNWNLAYGWGNHSTAGYITSESDTLLQSRTTAQASTTSIADGASTYINIAVAKTYALLKIGTTHASWIRLYTDELSRSSDSTRLQGVDPSPSSGVISEIITTGAEEIRLTPATIGWNDDTPASTNVYISVKNLSGQSAAITVTLTYIKLEN